MIPMFSSRAASACSFYGKAPTVPVSVYSSPRTELACTSFQETEFKESVAVAPDRYFRTELYSTNIRRLEKQCSFWNTKPSTPLSAFNSRLAAQCTFYAKEPSVPP